MISHFTDYLTRENILKGKIAKNEIEEKIKKNFTQCWQYFFDYQIPLITRWKVIFGDIETWTIWGNCVYNQNLVMSKNLKNNQSLTKNNDAFIKRLNDYGNQGLNAMTISELTSIPRPTVLRKLKNLLRKKLLTKDKNLTGGTNVIKILSVDSALAITLDTTISSLSKNHPVRFTRNRNFSIDLVPELTPHVKDGVPMSDTAILSRQYEDPVLTIQHTCTSLRINGETAGTDYYVKKLGKANHVPKKNEIIKVQFICSHGAGAFNIVRRPILDPYVNSNSWFSNSVASENGGTHLELVKFSYTGRKTTTVTVNYELKVIKWGSKSVTMVIGVDDPTLAAADKIVE